MNIKVISSIFIGLAIIMSPTPSYSFEDYYPIFKPKYVAYGPESVEWWTKPTILPSEIESDSILTVKIPSPLHKCKPGAPLLKAFDIYLAKFDDFFNDTTNACYGNFTTPYVTSVLVDENLDGTYFVFVNFNSFIDDVVHHILMNGREIWPMCHIRYKNHIFLLNKSLTGMTEPTGTEENLILYVREIGKVFGQRSPKIHTKNEKPLKRLTNYIPWSKAKMAVSISSLLPSKPEEDSSK